MNKEENIPHKFNSISDFHRMLGLPKPLHPMISLVNNCDIKNFENLVSQTLILNFYKISFIKNLQGKVKYGQSYYDFDEGGMVFISPNQLLNVPENTEEYQGVNIYIHSDFLRNYPLANKIKDFGFFSYSANEALHLSDNEKNTILSIFKNIEEELQSRIDDFSQDVVISQLELLLNYSNRFYNRQFITRKVANNDLLQKLEHILNDYFNNEKALTKGIPTVQYVAENLNVSASYLSDVLRSLTGQNAQQHIHLKLIEKAKEKLSTTNLSISEIAYELGFEHSQSFSKLFKKKTEMTPLEYKQSFN